jgi:hypothetical protein
MKHDLYAQCRLSQNGSTQVAWIQKKLAAKGKTISLKDVDGLWLVEEVFEPTLPWEVINERSQDYKRTREASDI